MNAPDRFGVVRGDAGRRIGFLLTPEFSVLPFISAVEPLRVANRLSGRPLYRWHLFSLDGLPVTAANDMVYGVEASIASVHTFPVMIVCGPHDPNPYRDRRVFAWLRGLARHGAMLGALDTGSLLLARAGLLAGCRFTIHWENLPAFVEEFPTLNVSAELFEVDRDRMTCSGGTAALDMMLYMIEREHGRDLATGVAEMFMHHVIRRPQDPQRMSLRSRMGVSHPRFLDCVALMEANVEQPLELDDLAAKVGVSRRQVERLFRHYLHTTPSRYYMHLRLACARRLIEHTSLPIIEVAVACGFASPGHFSHCYRTLYGRSPREDRKGNAARDAG